MPSLKRPKSTLAQMALSFVCPESAKTGEDFGSNSGSKSARMAKLWQFSLGNPKPAFSEKVQRGDQEKFFKKSPKRMPSQKRPKRTVAQMALSPN